MAALAETGREPWVCSLEAEAQGLFECVSCATEEQMKCEDQERRVMGNLGG